MGSSQPSTVPETCQILFCPYLSFPLFLSFFVIPWKLPVEPPEVTYLFHSVWSTAPL